ncbi:MAG: NAD(P)H-binding protein [Anaerolineales bacterium]|nr:NAD(P)H-binding protein [Anaerolineales bacterium]
MNLVTGGSGYIGSHIVRRLVEEGKDVRVLVRNRERAEWEGRLSGLEVEWVQGDVLKPDTLAPAMEGVDVVVHTVAIAIEKGGRTYEEVNYLGTEYVVEAAKAAGVKRFINLSQLGANPDLPYRFLASKGKAQAYVAESGLDWTAFRPSVVWGPEDEFANTFAKLVPFSPIIFPIVGDENAKFQPIWVEDLATAIVRSIDDPSTIREEYEVGGPEILTLEEIERRTLVAVGARRFFLRFPMPLLRILVSLMQVFLPAPPVTRSLLELLAVSNVTQENTLGKFVAEPRPFTPENVESYMKEFRARETLAQFMGR